MKPNKAGARPSKAGARPSKAGARPSKAGIKLAVAVRARRERPGWSRRTFLTAGTAMLCGGGGLASHLLTSRADASERAGPPIRPPTALADHDAFLRACIRCGLCGTVCQNGCIRFFGADEHSHGALTPYLDVRRRSCTLCMRCTNICPTGALTPTPDDKQSIVKTVQMGVAVVDPDRCLSYLGRVCGYCHDACPLPHVAIRLIPPARPVVLDDGCVGCGRCVEFCPQVPTAIDVAAIGGVRPQEASS